MDLLADAWKHVEIRSHLQTPCLGCFFIGSFKWFCLKVQNPEKSQDGSNQKF